MSSIVKVDTIQENTSANGITVDGLNIKDSKLVTANSVVAANITADAIDATKIADNAIDSEHYTDASIDLQHLAADSVNATKIADNAISEEHLDVTSITGHTAETSIADGDLVLIHDASASALRKMTKANFVSGIGGVNTPAFEVSLSGNQSIDNSETSTKVTFDTETIDSDGKFASNKFTPTVAGTYFISLTVAIENGSQGETDLVIALLKKNGSTVTASDARVDFRGNRARGASVTVNHVIALDSDDYVEGFAAHAAGGGTTNIMQFGTRMGGFKLIT